MPVASDADLPPVPERRALPPSPEPASDAAAVSRRALLAAAARAGALLAGGTTLATLGVPGPLAAQPPAAQTPELYEWRTYRLTNAHPVAAFGAYLRDALVPALRRHGTGPVGVFTVAIGPDAPSFHVLVPHPSADSVARLPARLADDAEYRRAGAAVLDAPSSRPAFERLESALLVAFAGMPRLALPPAGARRLFELRRYESHSERASRTKIGMFDQAEIAIFRRAGMHPVFFGETIVGAHRPNLTYLLAYESMEDHDRQWSAFGRDPEWRALSARPEFADSAIVSRISSLYLRPTAFSQV